MDGFDDAFGAAPPEVDPAAEFLAKEQEELADLGEDLGFGLAAPPVSSPVEDFVNEVPKEEPPVENGFEHVLVEGFGMETKNQTEDFGADFQTEDFGAGYESTLPSTSEPFEVEETTRDFSALSMSKPEPECIARWKIEQEERLKAKDQDEEKKKEELKQQALQELQDWYKHYEEQLGKTKAANREEQKEFVAEVNNIAPGSEWERVATHCDFNAKVNKNVKDVSRMRSILLQLKQSPPTRD